MFKKMKLKYFLFSALSAVSISSIAPVLSSCSNKEITYRYDPITKEAFFNSKYINIPNVNNKNIFSFYKELLNNQTIKDEFNKEIILLSNGALNGIDLDFANAKIDLANFQILINKNTPSISDENMDLMSTKSIDNEIDKVVIDFPAYSKASIDNMLNKNTYFFNIKSTFGNKTIEDIWNMPLEEIRENLTLPNGTKFLINPSASENNPKCYGGITKNQNNQKELILIILTPENGLGQVVITSQEIQVANVEPSAVIKNFFNENVENEWPKILNYSTEPIKNWKFTNNIITATKIGDTCISYDDFLQENNDRLSTLVTNNFLDQKTFLDDYYFFIQNFLQNISNKWQIPQLMTASVFVNHEFNVNKNAKNITGKIGIQIRNTSNRKQTMVLPINGSSILVDPLKEVIITISFDSSNVSPGLVLKNYEKNEALLSTLFNNVVMNVYETNIGNNSESFINKQENNNLVESYNFGSSYVDVFGASYSLKMLVENVGYGLDTSDSTQYINQAYENINENELKQAELNRITNQLNTYNTLVSAVETIMLEIAENPTVYSLFQNKQFSSAIYEIIYALTEDQNIAHIISELFIDQKISDYLANNLPYIIKLLKAKNTNNSVTLNSIIDLLNSILDNSPTKSEMQKWVESIKGLYPTLEKLLGTSTKWIMPLLKQIMNEVSENQSIISLLFNNMDYVFNFLLSSSSKVSANVKSLINSLTNYLAQIINYQNTETGGQIDFRDYKEIRVLDIFAYELVNANVQNSIFSIIANVLKTSNPALSSTMTKIAQLLVNNMKVNAKINDYSNSEWNNKVILGTITQFNPGDPTLVNLTDQLGKCIKAIFNVYVDNKCIKLSEMIKNNISSDLISNTFSYNSNDRTVQQNLCMKLNFKQKVTWNTLPICVLLDNLNITIPNSINIGDNNKIQISTILKFLQVPFDQDANNNIVLSRALAEIFPTDISVDTDCYVSFQYLAKNAKLFPKISSDGTINFSYSLIENIGIEANSIWANSNQQYKDSTKTNELKKTAQYYGHLYGKLWPIVIGNLIKFDGAITNYNQVASSLNNPIVIPNYNSNIYDPNYVVTQKQTESDINTKLIEFINNNCSWTKSDVTGKPILQIQNQDTLRALVMDFLDLGDSVEFECGFSGTYYKLVNEKYNYKFTIYFNNPVLFTNINDEKQLRNELTFSFSMSQKPNPTTKNNLK